MNIVCVNNNFVEQIRQIYAPFVAAGNVSFELEVPDILTFEKRITAYTQKYPWLVAVENGNVLGYAYASAYRERIAYQWVAECSVYVAAGSKKAGVATQLYKALFDLLKAQGIYKVFAVITIPNPESVGFHEKFGFKWFANYKNVGYKFGKWSDVGWWELVLSEPETEAPNTPTPFPDLDQTLINFILEKYSK